MVVIQRPRRSSPIVWHHGWGKWQRFSIALLIHTMCGLTVSLDEQCVAAGGDCKVSPNNSLHNNMVEWLLKGGVLINGISGQSSKAGGGRGLFATKELKKNELLFTLPKNFWFTEETVATGSAIATVLEGDEYIKSICPKGDSWALILALEYERHNRFSPWRPYLDALPHPTSPLFWTSGQLRQLQSEAAVAEIIDIKDFIRQIYDQLFPYLSDVYPRMFDARAHTLESLTWSACSVWGRAFDLCLWNSTETVWGMLPFADLANHAAYVDNGYTQDARFYDLHVTEEKHVGDEIFISYGEMKTTFHFLVFYGFVPQGQHYGDYIVLDCEDESNYQQGHTEEGEPVRMTVAVGYDGRIPISFVEFVYRTMSVSPGKEQSPTLLKHVIEHMVRCLNETWVTFPTSLDDDVNLLESNVNLDHNLMTAITARIRFKSILKTTMINLEKAVVANPTNFAGLDSNCFYDDAGDNDNANTSGDFIHINDFDKPDSIVHNFNHPMVQMDDVGVMKESLLAITVRVQ
eukprot:m.40205 g.40205  ORF g.40205 m.40205 type:complete len:518 (+) comp18412_c0_seq1:273-1826(+)